MTHVTQAEGGGGPSDGVASPAPLVTVAIPTYNRATSFLPDSLRAACQQTYQNLEILVSDNASTDATEQLVRSQADPRIRYHRHELNIGAVGNVNSCISNARGAYLLLLMDDDLIDPDFVESCVAASRHDPTVGLIRTGVRVMNLQGVVLYESPNRVGGLDYTQFVLGWLEGKTAPFLCSTMFRTAPLREIGMRSRRNLWADVIAELPLAARLGRVDVPEVKATFRQHGDGITVGAQIESWCEDSQQLIDVACSLAPGEAELLRSRLVPFMAMFNYRNAIRFQGSLADRAAACATVKRHFGLPHDPLELLREVLRQTPLFETLRSVKRAAQRRS